MCIENPSKELQQRHVFQYDDKTHIAPEHRQVRLPRCDILRRLTDVHCHPTELELTREDVQSVGLGSVCAMATRVEDQDKVEALADQWPSSDSQNRPEVIACFGHHPWFAHHFSLESSLPSRARHYASIWLPASSSPSYTTQKVLLDTLLPYLPEPLSFSAASDKLERQIRQRVKSGSKWLLGELGIDKVARVTWPAGAPAEDGTPPRLTPFKTDVAHQREIVLKQMELALHIGAEEGQVVAVSMHGVGAAAVVQEILETMHKRHGKRFITGMNVDLHSAAGLHPNTLRDIQRKLPNIYISPSLALNATNAKGAPLIQTADAQRLLVESDTHDLRESDRRVWGAVVWIAGIRGWTEDETVNILEANWRRFIRSSC